MGLREKVITAKDQGAGGVITDWEGAPLTIRSGHRFLSAGDPRMHAQALELLAGR